jgi:serine/threonine protein kinase
MEAGEDPCPRKLTEMGSTIYTSRLMMGGVGPLYLCDFGLARIGSEHEGMAMPLQYRAPEVIFGMKWGHAVDMWSVALTVRAAPFPGFAGMARLTICCPGVGLGATEKSFQDSRPR